MNRLWVRLSIGFLLVTWIVLAIVMAVVFRAVDTSFRQYVTDSNAAMMGGPELVANLQAYFQRTNSWDGVEALLPTMGHGNTERRGRGGVQSFVADTEGVIVAATNLEWIGQSSGDIAAVTTPIEVNGTLVGALGQQMPGLQVLGQTEERFRTQIIQAFVAIFFLMSLLALALGVALSYTLARPLERLAQRIRGLAAGRLGEQVRVEGPTEVRALATEFNAMSTRLADSERQRQQMTSDVAHELRTPVTVLRGHLEAMMDGVYPMDVAHVAVAYDQTIQLARLVEDLRLLTQAEGRRLPLNLAPATPAEILVAALSRFEPLAQDADLELTQQISAGLPLVNVDAGRLQQVFDNLLANALRHTEAGGGISLEAAHSPSGVRFVVGNTGDLPAEQMDHIFDRFWRAAEAQRRDAGGSGLGLAITRQLVLLQGGEISVASSDGWTTFAIDLPAYQPGASL